MRRLILGFVVAIAVVLGNGLLTWNTTGLSYDRFTWVAYAALPMYPMTEDEVPGGCTDGIDNDMDGDIDCADEDCANVVPCVAPAPVISPTGLVILMSLMILIGAFGILRRRTQEG